ncbi:MAG: hypothetical protein F6K41_05930 [Symploca sp. SIO3E6]|nr:hypothetical protein [Caldora sp. SIO3E6]
MTNQLFTNGYALLIGVGDDLPVTVKDATALRDVLVNPHRAAYPLEQVVLLTENSAHRQGILAEFDKLIEQCKQNPEATTIVYYSGHGGYRHFQGTNEYFLLPYGYNSSQQTETAIFGSEFTQKIEAIKAQKLIVLLDCCHAGGIPKEKDSGTGFVKSPPPQQLLDALSSGSGRVIVASSQEDEKSYIGYGDPYSIFTTCLLEALQGKAAVNKDGYARILDILIYLFNQVPQRAPAPQHPLVKKMLDLGDNFPLCYYAGGSKSLPGESDSPQPPPLESPKGPVPLDSKFYQARLNAETKDSIEQESFKEIQKPGALLLVKGGYQMGKTSLLTQIQEHASQQGYQSVTVKFREVDASRFKDTSKFLQWFCSTITNKLGLTDKVTDFWRVNLSDKQICIKYLREYLLQQLNSPLLLGLDDVDTAFHHLTVAGDFFTLLKVWYEEAKEGDEDWQKLRLVINYITEQHRQLDGYKSPFNVGRTIILPEFTQEEIRQLAHRHSLSWGVKEIQQLTAIIGGHPYLVRMALYTIAIQELSLSDFLQIALTPAGPYSDSLDRKRKSLSSNESLFNSFQQVIESNQPVDINTEDKFTLLRLGLVKFYKNTDLIVPLCELYRMHFRP